MDVDQVQGKCEICGEVWKISVLKSWFVFEYWNWSLMGIIDIKGFFIIRIVEFCLTDYG